jgi:hypothetical protein
VPRFAVVISLAIATAFVRPGTDVMIFKKISQKNYQKIGVFDSKPS